MTPARLGRLAAFLAALASFVVYYLTLARTVTWLHNGADSGDLATAAFTLGIPHPPGYPLYTLIAAAFARIPGIEPAFGVGIFSALAASGAVLMLSRAGDALLSSSPNISPPAPHGSYALALIPPLAALAFAFAPMLWSQATIAEVYALNLFFVAIILWACLKSRIYIAALAFGLGMTHHLAILLLLPGALIALKPKLRDTGALLLLLAPLLLYAYLPITARHNPPVIWGDPQTVDRFIWLVTAAQYRTYLFGVNANEVLIRVAFAARALLDQFTLVGIALLVWGVIQLALTRQRIAIATALMFFLTVAYAVIYASRDSFLYLLPAFAVVLLWLIYGAGDVIAWFGDDRMLRAIAVALFALLPAYNLITNYGTMDISRDRTAFEYAKQNLAPLPVDTVLFADGDEALFALWYYRHAVAFQNARSVIVSQGLLQYDWYYDALRRTMSEVQFAPPDQVTDAHQRARELIRVTFAEGRAVCFTESSPLLPEFEYVKRGVVQCVLAEK